MYLHVQAVGFVKLNCLGIICHSVVLFLLAVLTYACEQVSHSQLLLSAFFLYTVCKEKQKMMHLKQICEKLMI
jgi:hypothetical protein